MSDPLNGTTSGDTYQVFLNLYNNNAPNSGVPDSGAGSDYLIRERQSTTVHLSANGVSYGGGNADIAAVAQFVKDNNIGTETVFVATPAAGAPGYVGGTPALPLLADSSSDTSTSPTSTAPTPIRNRAYSVVPRCAWMSRKPLCPPCVPRARKRSLPSGRLMSSQMTSSSVPGNW